MTGYTPEELAHLVIVAYPNHFRSVDTKTVWTNTFKDALKNISPEDLKYIWKVTMRDWNSASFPKPEDFKRNLPGVSSTSDGINRKEMLSYGKLHMYEATDQVINGNPEKWKVIMQAGYDFSARCDIRDVCQKALESFYLFEHGHREGCFDYMKPEHRKALYAGHFPDDPLEHYFKMAKMRMATKNHS